MKEIDNTNMYSIREPDIDTIAKTKQRLFQFQITQSDLDLVREQFGNTNLKEVILHKHKLIMNRVNGNTVDERESILANFKTYIDSLSNLDINTAFFSSRKALGNAYNQANMDDDLLLSSHGRILEVIIPEIVKKYSHHTDKMINLISAMQKIMLFDYRLISKFKNEETNLEIIKNINGIMNSIMDINHTDELFKSIDATTEQTDNVAAATEQLSASVTNILNTISSVSSNSKKLVEGISSGQTEIENSLNDIVSLNYDFTRTKANINDLVSDIRNISQIIEFIKNVSEQTTLLAINASIEASRGGENGKGFSVIADEIRKLSEQTTESVEDITKVIKNVEEDTRKVDRNTQDHLNVLREKTGRAQKAISTLDEITTQTREVGNFTSDMTEVLDEQYISTQKIKNFLDDVIQNSAEVRSIALTTGQSVYNVSREIEDLRTRTIDLIPDLRHKHYLNIMKIEEQLKKWWAYNALLGYHDFNPNDELDAGESRFWEWYSKAKNNPNISSLYPFKQLEEKHLELFHIEEKVRYLLGKNKKEAAKKMMKQLEGKIDDISHLLEVVEKEI